MSSGTQEEGRKDEGDFFELLSLELTFPLSLSSPWLTPVFNFWEPLHYLSRGAGFQTWELSPQYAIRSWAYVATYLPAAEIVPYLMNLGKVRLVSLPSPTLSPLQRAHQASLFHLSQRQAFFCVRILSAFICSFVEARFYRAVVEHVNDRVGRYFLFGMLLSAGMWNASTGELHSYYPIRLYLFR